MVNEAWGVDAANRSRSTFDLGLKALSNQHLDKSLLLKQGQLVWRTEGSTVCGGHMVNRGVPLAIGVVASRSFWNDIGEVDCFASSRWTRKFRWCRMTKMRVLTFGLALDLVDPPDLIKLSCEREENPACARTGFEGGREFWQEDDSPIPVSAIHQTFLELCEERLKLFFGHGHRGPRSCGTRKDAGREHSWSNLDRGESKP